VAIDRAVQTEGMVRIALILLVDDQGRIFVQLHDEQAATRPNRWSLPGGLVGDGESPAQAARRIAAEQAGVPLAGEVAQFWSGFVPGHRVLTYAFWARTPATDADIAVRTDINAAGVAPLATGIVQRFLPGDEVLNGRSYSIASGYVLARFVESAEYQAIDPSLGPTRLPYLE
jgi:ADP-ribose pyrophosphatase YjhB (NUDIX family)